MSLADRLAKAQQRDRISDVRARVQEQVAREHQAGFLALDLAGVDVGLDVRDRPTQATRLGGTGDQRP